MAQSKFDPFFSRSMEFIPIAQDLFWHYHLANTATGEIVETLVRVDRTNTNKSLEKHHRDIAYAVTMQGGQKHLMCVEHQSEPDITMPARFLEYSGGDLKGYLSKYQEIPFIANMLLYNGNTSPYPYHDTLQAYYPDPAVGGRELNLRFHIIDLTQIGDEKLVTHGYCAPMEILLKHGRSANFELAADAYREVFQACVAAMGDVYLLSILDYVASLHSKKVGKKMYDFIKEIFDNKNNTVMTYGDELREEGKQEGMTIGEEKGRQEGRQEGMAMGEEKVRKAVAKNMLCNLRLDVDVITKATGLSTREVIRLAS